MAEQDDTELDQMFAQARAATPVPGDALRARILADAMTVQDGFAPALPARVHTPGPGRQLRELLGGWPGLAGLATACACGVWLGFSPPADWADPAALMVQQDSVLDLFESEELAFVLSIEEG